MQALYDPRRWKKRYDEPSLAGAVSQLCTQAQCDSREFAFWCAQMKIQPGYHRKQWEFCYILQVLAETDMLRRDRSGIGFGVGREPLPAVMAAHGCTVLATDMPESAAVEQGWATTGQHANSLASLNEQGICDPELFRDRVRYRVVNMNDMPDNIGRFDFTWSSCALEHLGSIDRGLQFVRNSLNCLRPGGIAVHTTEFNLSSNWATLGKGPTVIFRRKDIEKFVRTLSREGHQIELNLNPGGGAIDKHVDLPPYAQLHHLKLRLDKYVSTSIGLKVRKAA
jgi:hypothetical protein